MWRFTRKGVTHRRYSIGEKIKYYKTILNHSNDQKRRKKARSSLQRLRSYINSHKIFGKVFMVKDRCFNPHERDPNKSRRVVAIGSKNDVMSVIPVRKQGKLVHLSNFDGKRSININSITDLSLDNIYEKNYFPKTQNDRLTTKEKEELYRKLHQ